MLGPGVVGDGGMARLVLCAAVVCHCALLWAWRRRHPRPAHCPVFAAVGSLRPGCSGGRGNFSPPHPCPSSLGPPSVAVVTPGFLSPRLNSAPPGVLAPCGDSTLRPLRGRTPVGFFATLEALRPPSSSPTMGDSWATMDASRPPSLPHTTEVLPPIFSRLPPFLPLCDGLAPWRTCAPALLAAAEGDLPVLPPPAHAYTCVAPAPISCVPYGVDVRVSLPPSAPPRGHCFLLPL